MALKDRRALVFIVIDHPCSGSCHVDEGVTNVFDLEHKVSNWPTTRAAFRINYDFTPMSTETDEKSEVLRIFLVATIIPIFFNFRPSITGLPL